MKITASERFYSKVRKGKGCWLWLAARNGDGYGAFWFAGRIQRAHRVAWQIAYGEIPKKLQVLHTCDNPRCVRLSHLYLGTQQDNMDDMVFRGRVLDRRGKTANALFDTYAVASIRGHHILGDSIEFLAKQYGCSYSTIYKIVKRKTYDYDDY